MTARSGLTGSDCGGIVALLLGLSAAAVLVYQLALASRATGTGTRRKKHDTVRAREAGHGWSVPRREAAAPVARERRVLEIAVRRGGVVTAAEVALDSDIGLDEAVRLLENLGWRGHCHMRGRAAGRRESVFPDLVGDAPRDSG